MKLMAIEKTAVGNKGGRAARRRAAAAARLSARYGWHHNPQQVLAFLRNASTTTHNLMVQSNGDWAIAIGG